jgi:hypothetical protein
LGGAAVGCVGVGHGDVLVDVQDVGIDRDRYFEVWSGGVPVGQVVDSVEDFRSEGFVREPLGEVVEG